MALEGATPPFWSVLRALREARGVTQDGWAALLQVSARTVFRWEHGEAVPDARTEEALLAECAGRSLLRTYDQGVLQGIAVTAAWLRDVLAAARAAETPATSGPISPPAAPPTNLPAPLTSFVGREAELASVRQLLTTTRLLTLTGAGGVGKTRLALETAGLLVDQYPHGVWLTELAALTDPTLVPQAVATALGLREEPGRSPVEALREYLRPRRLLLVLDNCEHLVTACAALVEALLHVSPHLRVLATSREALGLVGETRWRVRSLAVPDATSLPPTARLAEFEAVLLFVERARAVLPGFALTDENARAVVEICRRLDGIPLAIELAAARVTMLSVQQLAGRIGDCFRLLTGGGRTALPRQQTLRAAIDWSYALLSEPEQALFRRLAVFAGGWTLDAAEALSAEDDGAVLDLLGQLVGKSLVLADFQASGETHYRMLETIRQYAWEKLTASGEAATVRSRHLAWWAQLPERLSGLESPEAQKARLERIDADHANIRAALEWATEGGDIAAGLTLAVAVTGFWEVRGHLGMGRRWLDRLLTMGTDAPVLLRARALLATTGLAYRQDDYLATHVTAEAALALFRELDDERGIASALNFLGLAATQRGDQDEAVTFLREALELNHRQGLKPAEAWCLNNLGVAAMQREDFVAASGWFEQALTLHEELGDRRGIAFALSNLGRAAMRRNDLIAAWRRLEEGLAVHRELHDLWGIAWTQGTLGLMAAQQERHEQAEVFLREAAIIHRELGSFQLLASTLLNLGESLRRKGKHEEARVGFEECLILVRGHDLPLLPHLLHSLGALALAEGDATRAENYFCEALRTGREEPNRSPLLYSIEGLATVAARRSHAERAARLLGAAHAHRAALGLPRWPADRADLDGIVTAVRDCLGPEAFDAVSAEGRALSLDAAIALALETSGPPRVSS